MTGSGWIKLHRQALQNGWLRNHRLWVFWTYCLMKASHKPATARVGFQRVALESGQFVFGRKQAAADLGMTERQVRTCLNSLISTNNLTTKATNKFSIVSVVNWHSYQDIKSQNDQQNDQKLDQQVTSNRPAEASNFPENRANPVPKNVKNIKKKPLPAKKPPADSRLFVNWFCYAFEICQGYRYDFEGGKDGKALSEMLKAWPWKELVSKACHFLTDGDRFPKSKAPTLSFLRSKINDYPNHINGQADNFRELGLLPPDGTLLENWAPWNE